MSDKEPWLDGNGYFVDGEWRKITWPVSPGPIQTTASQEMDAKIADLRAAGLTLKEVGATVGMSRQRVQQRIKRHSEQGADLGKTP